MNWRQHASPKKQSPSLLTGEVMELGTQVQTVISLCDRLSNKQELQSKPEVAYRLQP